jgi:acid phosphatase type 7
MKLMLAVWLASGYAGLYSCSTEKQEQVTVKTVIDRVVTDLYATRTAGELSQISQDNVMELFTEEERKALAATHWMFDVNVPAVVSVMRSVKQETLPFWLEKEGFILTDKVIRNAQTTYEVWQKNFSEGRVGLGINGFENYGLHYFVSVAPQAQGDSLVLTGFFPENQYVGVLEDGAFTYHDWTELVVTDVPVTMKGQLLLTTVRGRGVESHLIGAFRSTDFPSSEKPDQVMVTWSGDPQTTIDVQWRTSEAIKEGAVLYRQQGSGEVSSSSAEYVMMEDRLLMNDRFIHRHTARLNGLKPGTVYEYIVMPGMDWENALTFTTAAPDNTFEFLWFTDTHNSSHFGEIIHLAYENHPDIAFFAIAGDLVNDGLHRNQWDELFNYSGTVIPSRPLMAVPGNHDNRAGLGARMFREMFSYPLNGPAGVEKEQTYAFTYKNCLFLMLDATSPIEQQNAWIEEQLAGTTATWKIAITHFPPYNFSGPYENIQKEWIPLFDKYHVDLVFSGHIHYYMRSRPMRGGEVAEPNAGGTVYVISVAVPARDRDMGEEPYAAVRNSIGHQYQHIRIKDNELEFTSVNINNEGVDTFRIKK